MFPFHSSDSFGRKYPELIPDPKNHCFLSAALQKAIVKLKGSCNQNQKLLFDGIRCIKQFNIIVTAQPQPQPPPITKSKYMKERE